MHLRSLFQRWREIQIMRIVEQPFFILLALSRFKAGRKHLQVLLFLFAVFIIKGHCFYMNHGLRLLQDPL